MDRDIDRMINEVNDWMYVTKALAAAEKVEGEEKAEASGLQPEPKVESVVREDESEIEERGDEEAVEEGPASTGAQDDSAVAPVLRRRRGCRAKYQFAEQQRRRQRHIANALLLLLANEPGVGGMGEEEEQQSSSSESTVTQETYSQSERPEGRLGHREEVEDDDEDDNEIKHVIAYDEASVQAYRDRIIRTRRGDTAKLEAGWV